LARNCLHDRLQALLCLLLIETHWGLDGGRIELLLTKTHILELLSGGSHRCELLLKALLLSGKVEVGLDQFGVETLIHRITVLVDLEIDWRWSKDMLWQTVHLTTGGATGVVIISTSAWERASRGGSVREL
jgi:hypothetical protein